jgi:hypothetical protein
VAPASGRVEVAAEWWRIPVVGDSEADLEDRFVRWTRHEAEGVEAELCAIE